MTHKTRAVAARLLIGGLLLGVPLVAGCGGGGSSSQSNQIVKGASITKQAKVVAADGLRLGGAPAYTIYILQDGDGLYYAPDTLDPAFQKDGLRVQFTAIVIDPVVPSDGAAFLSPSLVFTRFNTTG